MVYYCVTQLTNALCNLLLTDCNRFKKAKGGTCAVFPHLLAFKIVTDTISSSERTLQNKLQTLRKCKALPRINTPRIKNSRSTPLIWFSTNFHWFFHSYSPSNQPISFSANQTANFSTNQWIYLSTKKKFCCFSFQPTNKIVRWHKMNTPLCPNWLPIPHLPTRFCRNPLSGMCIILLKGKDQSKAYPLGRDNDDCTSTFFSDRFLIPGAGAAGAH